MKLKLSRGLFHLLGLPGLIVLFSAGAQPAWAGPAATATTLIVTSGSSVVASGGSLASGSKVTLTAAVVSGSTNVTFGQVNFCDASALSCTDIHLIGTAQLTSAGTAVLSLHPAIGSHSYKAVFAATPNGKASYAASVSGAMSLTVTGSTWPTVTSYAANSEVGNYTLTATVGTNATAAPTGTVSFLDTSDGNLPLGSATLGAGTAGLNFLPSFPLVGGAFGAPVIAIADFNGDGNLDVVSATAGGCDTPCLDGGVVANLGNGTGNFSAAPALDLGNGFAPFFMAVGDFNGDGISDLAVLDDDPTSTITILLGNGDGTFTNKGNVANDGNIQPLGTLAVGDFNGDGIPDLIGISSTGNLVILLLGNGDGTFTPSASATSAGTNAQAFAVGDFNGDGIPDLAIVNNNYPSASSLTTLLGNGDGTFSSQTSALAGNYPSSIAVGDFNRDGILDVALTNLYDSTVTILLGTGTGTFTQAPQSPVALVAGDLNQPGTVLVADFNGDGKADLAIASDNNIVSVLQGNGDGTFQLLPLSASINFTASGDFNGDGRTDLAGNASVYLDANWTAAAVATGIAVPPATGTAQVVASYAGDSSNNASTSIPITLTAAAGTPTVVLTVSPNPATYGANVTLTATVTGAGATPTRTVTFYDGSLQLGTGTLNSSGVATFSSSTLAVGASSLIASYAGDENYIGVNSASVTLTITAALSTPAVTVTPSATSITAAQSLTVPVAVSGSTGGATPSGTVTLASGSYTAQQPLAGGVASFTIAPGALNSGADMLTATYSGNGNYSTAIGTATVTVSAVGLAIPAPASVAPGASATATATFTASESYTGTLNLTCALTGSPSGAANLPTCSMSPTSVTLKAGASGTSTLTVATTAASTSAQLIPSRKNLWRPGWRLGGGSAALAVLLMCGIPARRRRWMSMLALLWVVGASLAIGCGGGGMSTTGTSTQATTAGNYVFTVTGTDSASPTIATSTSVTVSVQ
jgi:hypothetical protein